MIELRHAISSMSANRLVMNLPFSMRVALPAILLLTVPVTAAADDPINDLTNARFLNQLLRRGFYELAEQHCEACLKQAGAPWVQAQWHVRLADITYEHAWRAEQTSQRALLNTGIERLTNYLNRGLRREDGLLIRLQIAEGFVHSVRIGLVRSEAGRLMPAPNQQTNLQRVSADFLKSHNATIDRGLGLVDSVLTHLEEIRGKLDREQVTELRDRGRLLRGTLLALSWRLNRTSPTAGERLRNAAAALQTCQRSTRDSAVKYQACWLLSELRLFGADRQKFELQMRTLDALAEVPDDAQVPLAEELRIRSLLQHQDAPAAAQMIAKITPRSTLEGDHLLWLRMEAVLGDHLLAAQLEDDTALKAVDTEFEKLTQRLVSTGTGVYRDAADSCRRRFELIREVGIEVTDLIEDIERQRSAGDHETALKLVELALRRLAPTAWRSRGALQLRAGETLIALRKWDDASTRLKQATSHFKIGGLTAQQAAADLLRIFVMGQQLRGSAEVTVADYVAALETHTTDFEGQPSVKTANEWLTKMLVNIDPHKAVDRAMIQLRSETRPGRQTRQLAEVGRLLRACTPPDKSVVTEYREQLAMMLANEARWPEEDLLPARIHDLFLYLSGVAVGDYPEELEQHRRAISTLNPPAELQSDVTILKIIFAARESPTQEEVVRLVPILLEQATPACAEAMRTLSPLVRAGGEGATQAAILLHALVQDHLGRDDLTMKLSEILGHAVDAAHLTRSDVLVNQILNAILGQKEHDLVAVADVMKRYVPRKGEKSSVARTFWRQIISAEKQGSDAWLEANLQLARIAIQNGDTRSARRQLGVVGTLYPSWGNEDRRKRAGLIQGQLTN